MTQNERMVANCNANKEYEATVLIRSPNLGICLFKSLEMKQDGRLPPAHFPPSQFGIDATLKDENVFSSKKTLFHHIF